MIKSLAKKVVLGSGALQLAGSIRRPSVAILMYHSVLEDPSQEIDSLGGIIHSTAEFRGQMELLARKFHPVSLDDVSEFVISKKDLPKRAVVVTFDDGYTDNYEVAMPILDRFGVPAAFYVTVDCVENRRLPWPSRLRFSFRSTKKKEWTEPLGKKWPLQSAAHREIAYLKVCDEVCKLAGE